MATRARVPTHMMELVTDLWHFEPMDDLAEGRAGRIGIDGNEIIGLLNARPGIDRYGVEQFFPWRPNGLGRARISWSTTGRHRFGPPRVSLPQGTRPVEDCPSRSPPRTRWLGSTRVQTPVLLKGLLFGPVPRCRRHTPARATGSTATTSGCAEPRTGCPPGRAGSRGQNRGGGDGPAARHLPSRRSSSARGEWQANVSMRSNRPQRVCPSLASFRAGAAKRTRPRGLARRQRDGQGLVLAFRWGSMLTSACTRRWRI